MVRFGRFVSKTPAVRPNTGRIVRIVPSSLLRARDVTHILTREVHLHFAVVPAADQHGHPPPELSWEEITAAQQFADVALVQRYWHAHALLRRTLSQYTAVRAADWRLSRTGSGRPEIAAPADTGLRFSLSYGQGLVAVAVTRQADLGFDLACVQRDVDELEIAEYAFAAAELTDLRARGARARRERFFAYWTLKEAYAKAKGTGLLPGRQTPCFSLRARRIALIVEPGERTEDWQFAFGDAPLDHRWAVALHLGGAPLRRD